MRKRISDALVPWLTTLLFGIWGVEIFCFAFEISLSGWILLPVLCVWTLALTILDERFGFWSAATLVAVSEIVPFAVLGGREVVSCTVAVLTGGEVKSRLVLYAVVLMGAAVFSMTALYLLGKFAPRMVWCVIWTGIWIWAAMEEWEIPKIALAAGAVIVLMTLAEMLRRHRNADEAYPGLHRAVTVFLTLVGLVLCLLPAPPEPYPYPVLNAIVNKVEEVYDDMVTELLFREEGDSEFSMDFAGYSEDGMVGEGFQRGERASGVYAKSWLTTDGSLYLTGNTWDTFDGREWHSDLDDSSNLLDWNLDAAERIYALWRYQQNGDTAAATAYMRATSVYITYEGLSTRTLFTAPFTTYVSTDKERFPWDGKSGRVLFDYLQTRDTFYRVYYLEQNDARIGELALASDGYVYDEESEQTWLKIFGDYRPEFGLTRAVFDPNDRIEPILAQRQAKIYDAYLQLPENLSEEVCGLAEEITASCGTDYEKLLAIADYLRSNYTYTAEPAPVPEDAVFLDHVLFGAEEGYCTWYATAATILARCVGIPARYAQGYCASLDAGVTTALDEMGSHAWCEGYLPGMGWVTVEATPGFLNAGDGWESFPDRDTEPEELPEDLPEEAPEKPAAEFSIDWSVLLAGAVVLLAAAGAAVLPGWLRMRKAYRAASWSGKIRMDLVRFLGGNVRRDLRRRGDESVRQYFSRLRWMLRLQPERIDSMTDFYEEILFAEREATEAEWQESRAFLREMNRTRRKRKPE